MLRENRTKKIVCVSVFKQFSVFISKQNEKKNKFFL